ncbi:MAG: hypothetical protein FWC57_05295 [Endomicrobia bacterium]|nr:hypothetical protein [Endomicrobiia bacterium]
MMSTLLLTIYNLLFAAMLVPAALFLLLFSGKYRKEVFYKLSERFAFWNKLPRSEKKTVWLHCASLGEVRAVEPLISGLSSDYFVVLTALTKTGREYAEKINKTGFSAFLPLDLYPLMCKAFKAIKPDLLVLVETELWPSMLYCAHKKGVKIMTINARMSEKTFKFYNFAGFFWRPFVRFIDIVLARNAGDAGRFARLAGGRTEVYVSGNIKYDRDFSVNASRKDFGLNDGDLVFSAGSTREGEEAAVAAAYKKLSEKYADIKFFMAPRHLSRIEKVKDILKAAGIKFSLFSDVLLTKSAERGFILVDVFGKLQSIYAVSDICFVGGSIVEKGGQNPIEPAAYGKPVLFGRNMENFKTEAETLIKYGGGIIVSGADDLAVTADKLLSHKDLIAETGQNALKAVESQKGAVAITIKEIKRCMEATYGAE